MFYGLHGRIEIHRVLHLYFSKCSKGEYDTKGFRDNADTERAISHVRALGIKIGFIQ